MTQTERDSLGQIYAVGFSHRIVVATSRRQWGAFGTGIECRKLRVETPRGSVRLAVRVNESDRTNPQQLYVCWVVRGIRARYKEILGGLPHAMNQNE